MEDWDADLSPRNFATTHFLAERSISQPQSITQKVHSRSAVDSSGARTLVFAAFEPSSSCEFRAWEHAFVRHFGAFPKQFYHLVTSRPAI